MQTYDPVKSDVKVLESIHAMQVTCSVYHSFDEIRDLQPSWDSFVESVNGDIYLSFDWCRIWWQFYGKGNILRLLIAYRGTEIVGIIPIFIESLWLGPAWLKMAKIAVSDFTMVIVNPPVRSDCAAEVFNHFFDLIINKEGCDAVRIGPLGGQYETLQQLRETISQHPKLMLFQDSARLPYTTFHLPKTFEEYIQSLDKRQRGNLRRDLNLINKSFKMSQDVIQGQAAADEFGKFVQMHNQQWEAEGKLGHFKDWPHGEAFNAALVSEQAKQGRLKLLRLIADNQVVSYQLCFAFGKRWYWRLPARLVGPEWDKFALGRIGLINEIEIAIAEGVQEIEAGIGHYEYKVKLGGKEYPLYSIMLVRNTIFCRLRVHIFKQLSRALNYFYYRVWFHRVAPKLPFKRRHLWKLWIKSQL